MWASVSDKDGSLTAGAKLYGVFVFDAFAGVG